MTWKPGSVEEVEKLFGRKPQAVISPISGAQPAEEAAQAAPAPAAADQATAAPPAPAAPPAVTALPAPAGEVPAPEEAPGAQGARRPGWVTGLVGALIGAAVVSGIVGYLAIVGPHPQPARPAAAPSRGGYELPPVVTPTVPPAPAQQPTPPVQSPPPTQPPAVSQGDGTPQAPPAVPPQGTPAPATQPEQPQPPEQPQGIGIGGWACSRNPDGTQACQQMVDDGTGHLFSIPPPPGVTCDIDGHCSPSSCPPLLTGRLTTIGNRIRVQLGIHGAGGLRSVSMLVDTGAGNTVLPMAILEAAGYKPTGPAVQLRGISSTPVDAYPYRIPYPAVADGASWAALGTGTVTVYGIDSSAFGMEGLLGPELLRNSRLTVQGRAWALSLPC